MTLSINQDDRRQFRFEWIKIPKQFPAPIKHTLKIVFENYNQVNFVINSGCTIDTVLNVSIVCVDAYMRTRDIRKIIDEVWNQSRRKVSAVKDTTIYMEGTRWESIQDNLHFTVKQEWLDQIH